MNFITDHFTLQGAALVHIEHGCQDYAHSFTNGDLSVALVSDGCSSAPNSDVGARLLVLTAGTLITKLIPGLLDAQPDASASFIGDELQRHIIGELGAIYGLLNRGAFLGPLMLDCTLLAAIRYKNRCIVLMYGDGYVAVDYKDGITDVHNVEFKAVDGGVEHSMPHYLAYHLPDFRERLLAYESLAPRREYSKIYRTSVNGTWVTLPTTVDGEWKRQFTLDVDLTKANSVVISSDGIGSFGSDVPFTAIADELLRFPPNSKGCILRRKLLFNSTRTWPKKSPNRWVHQDDLGLAGILVQ